MTPFLTLHGVSSAFGGPSLFAGVDLALHPGDRLCLIGRNGAGKSTLLRLVAGEVPPDAGRRHVQPGARVGYLAQVPDPKGFSRVRDWVEAAAEDRRGSDAAVPAHRVEAVLQGLQVDGEADPARLSGGELKRAALARTLVADPDVLLLDEPTNHLDLPTIAWLERYLQGFRGALLLVSHDRAFLRRLSRGMLWLDRGVLHRRDEGFDHFEEWGEVLELEEEGRRNRLDKKLIEENRWLHRGVTARRSRNMGRLRRLFDLRKERAEIRRHLGTARTQLLTGPVSGRLVFQAEGVSKTFGDRILLKKLDLTVLRGDRLGIVGPNGAGKTTLVRMLLGEVPPDTGRVRMGTNLEVLYFDQQRQTLDTTATLQEILCVPGSEQVMVGDQPKHVAGHLQDFLFQGSDLRRSVSTLSGGERARLLFAREFAKVSNLLVLDEPTNDLDLETLDLLEELLADYPGTVLIITHDRDFLDRVVTSTLVLDGQGGVMEYAGGWSDAERQGATAGPPEKPKEINKDAPRETGKDARARAKARLSYKEQQELATLTARVEALQAEIARLEVQFAEGRPTPEALKRHPAAQAELALAEERWLELSILAEA